MSETEVMEKRVADLRDRLHNAESLIEERENDIHLLKGQMRILVGTNGHSNGSQLNQTDFDGISLDVVNSLWLKQIEQMYDSQPTSAMHIPRETRELLANMSMGSTDIYPPGMYHYLPHLIGKPNALKPAMKHSKGRLGASIVMGIPTIKRDVDSYLVKTLISLVESLSTEERADCLIVVFCGEPWDLPYCQSIATLIRTKLSEHLDSGLIEIITPPAEFYPNLDNLPATFGDTGERVKWRTKQNLDYSFLMMYAKRRGTYYVQLEDDIVTKAGYFSTMKNFALNQKSPQWMLLEFSSLGFIGKLFKSKDLPIVVEFFLMFYKDKPIDWLLDHLLSVKVCNPEKDSKHCQRSVSELRRRFKPSLFQHVGTHSSLKGKVQKLKDRDFGKGAVRTSHFNPNADVSTTLKSHQRFTLDKAYQGENFFWGILPKKDDYINFEFDPPISIEKFLFRSGNTEHPGDKFYNTTVEVLPNEHVVKQDGPLNNNVRQNAFPRTHDGFLVLNHFNEDTGLAEGSVDATLGEIHTMRLHVQGPSDTWVILSEIYIKATPAR